MGFLNVKQMAEQLGVGQSKIYELVAEGGITHIWLGPRTLRFLESDIEIWGQDQSWGEYTSHASEAEGPAVLGFSVQGRRQDFHTVDGANRQEESGGGGPSTYARGSVAACLAKRISNAECGDRIRGGRR